MKRSLFEKKAKSDERDPRVIEWDTLMCNYQKTIPGLKPGEKSRQISMPVIADVPYTFL